MGALFSTSGGSWFSGFTSWWGKRASPVKSVSSTRRSGSRSPKSSTRRSGSRSPKSSTRRSPGAGVGFTKLQLQRFRNAAEEKRRYNNNGNLRSGMFRRISTRKTS